MELLQLIYFCDAAESENFTKVAKKHGVPTSNISQTVSRLENELEVKLFDRSANRVSLNEQGRAFYKQVKASLEMLKNAVSSVKDVSNEISGEIKLLVHTNRNTVIKAVEQFKNENPNIVFTFSNDLNADPDDFDIIISDDVSLYKNYDAQILIKEEIIVALLKDNPLSKKPNLTVSDLTQERFVTMQTGSSLYKHVVKICQGAGFEPNIAVQIDDPYYIRKYLEIGMGIAFVPSVSWAGLFSDNVILRKIGDYKRDTYIFTKRNKYKSFAVRKFCELLLGICS